MYHILLTVDSEKRGGTSYYKQSHGTETPIITETVHIRICRQLPSRHTQLLELTPMLDPDTAILAAMLE